MIDPCPVCGGVRSRPVAENAPYRRCRKCGAVFNTAHAPLSYSDSYFTADYKAQYGRTYEEDFDPIYRSAQTRISRLLKLWHSANSGSPSALLDIGCALGFFLKAAEDAGFTHLTGIEISQFAADYTRTRFGYAVEQKPFDAAGISGSYDAVTAWYFLEHLENTSEALSAICGSLRPGGVAAFSLPSYRGPLYTFNRKEWARTHPCDHRVDFSPGSVKAAMKRAGFRTVSVYPSGIHPERVISKTSPFFPLFAPLYGIFSRLTAFSDTIEVYALK
jgi:SAM-dependent methyltransferase